MTPHACVWVQNDHGWSVDRFSCTGVISKGIKEVLQVPSGTLEQANQFYG